MRTGVSTACLYPMEVEKALASLLDLDFKVFEIFFNTYQEIEPGFVRNLKNMVDHYGAQVRSVHPFTSGFENMLLFSNYPRRFEDGIAFYRKYFEAASMLGASFLVLHGQRDLFTSKISEEEYFERYLKLREVGREYGILLSQENVNALRSADPQFIARMRKYTKDDCSFVFDVKQAVRAGVDPFVMCAAMGKSLVHVHLNDNAAKTDCLLPGRGTMDFKRLMRQLQEQGYQGDFIIEVYRDNFGDIEEFVPSFYFVQGLIHEVFKIT